MLVQPNHSSNKGVYLPYILTEMSQIYNSFDTIVIYKYSLKDNTENQNLTKNILNILILLDLELILIC